SRRSNPNIHSYTFLHHVSASGPPTLGAVAISFRSSCRRRLLALLCRHAALLPTSGRPLRRLTLLPSSVLLLQLLVLFLQSPVVARSWPEVRVHRFVAPPPPHVITGSLPPSWFITLTGSPPPSWSLLLLVSSPLPIVSCSTQISLSWTVDDAGWSILGVKEVSDDG
ncbi:hypothetical protein PIB30_098069, partial [Stylosanthes scabra]|nr:hypothetical protein [Stylosanthes scabra]